MALKSNYLRIWLGLSLVLAAFPHAASANSDWFTRVWQIDDGVPDNNINRIVQGPDDDLWLVTPMGLIRFDGVKFNPAISMDVFTGPYVREITCSRTGVLWVAIAGGKIIGLNPDFSTVSFDGHALPERTPTALATDFGGALFAGYSDAIYCLREGVITRFDAKDGVPPGTLHALVGDGAGNIWLSKGNQLSCLQNQKFQRIASVVGVQCLAATRSNAVWLVANAHLFSCNLKGELQDCGAFQHPFDAGASAMLEDREGSVWIGTRGNGLFHYVDFGFERVKTSHSSILCLAEDRDGDIWVGTGGGGLNRITPCGIQLETLGPDQVHSQIQSICQDAGGVLWGATQNGLLVSRFGHNWKPVFTNSSMPELVTCVAADHDAVWVGTRNGELARIAKTNGVPWKTNIFQGSINGLLTTARGDLWVVGSNLLQRFHGDQAERVRLPRRIRGIYAIAEDVSGKVWVGANGILLCFDGTNRTDLTPLLQGSGDPICCLYGSSDGSMWVGSRAGGLMRVKNGSLERIGPSQGLANNSISQIVRDKHGWLWIGSNRGIFKLREREVEEALADRGKVLRPILYGKNEGLFSQEAVSSLNSPFILPHPLLGRDGHVSMLTHTGIIDADPNVLAEGATPPHVLLTEVVVDARVLVSQDGTSSSNTLARLKVGEGILKLASAHRHLELDFTAFHYHAPQNIRFRYQLAGYDNDWIDAGTERSASYSRLPAGNYQFRVEASVGDGAWSSPPATLDFEVTPFFWQTWWFRLGALVMFTASLVLVVRYVSYRRLRLKLRASQQLSAVERERGRIARDIHDDLGNRLTEIQLLSGLAQRNQEMPENAATHIGEISFAARQATDALDEIVWAINPRNDTLPHLINYLGQFTTDYLRTARIPCRVDLPENPPARSVSAEVRHNLFLVIKESLNNIVRHSQATEVSILFRVSGQSLSIIIQDNGRGFNGAPQNNGADGLENMRRRITEIGGTFEIQSKPGLGTRISLNGAWLANN